MNQIQILAVDDHISSLLALKDILTDVNAHLIKATSAKEALIIMLNKTIDCVLLDVSMPDMDGFEFLKTLHSAPAHAKIPVIMVTGKIFSENETLMAYKYGAVDFLLKPLDPEIVYRKVSFIVQQAQRIKSIRGVEEQLRKLENDIIQPLEKLAPAGALEPEQIGLADVLQKLKELDMAWKGVN